MRRDFTKKVVFEFHGVVVGVGPDGYAYARYRDEAGDLQTLAFAYEGEPPTEGAHSRVRIATEMTVSLVGEASTAEYPLTLDHQPE